MTEGTRSENVTFRFCNNFSIITSYLACEMCANLELNWCGRFGGGRMEGQDSSSIQLQKQAVDKTTRTAAKCTKIPDEKMHVQSTQNNWFSLRNL